MQDGGEVLPRNILACRGILVKMLLSLELHGIFFIKLCILIHFTIIETIIKMVIRLCQVTFFLLQSLVTVWRTCVSIMLNVLEPAFVRNLYPDGCYVLKHLVGLRNIAINLNT